MRRITFVIVGTAAILILLFSYRTSTSGPLVSSSATSKAHVLTPVATVTTASGPPTPDPSSAAQITTSQAATSTASKRATSGDGSSTKSSSSKTSAAIGSSPTTAPTTTAATAPVVVDGASAMTRYGPIQVEVTITAGKITDVQAIQYPNQDPRDQEINSQAIPVLHDQVIAAQSANVDGVSGATYTTQGYAASLQSALDAANFK